MGTITNISMSYGNKCFYTTYAERVAAEFPDYDIVVDGGAWRYYNCCCDVDVQSKIIVLDFYLPYHIDFEKCLEKIIRTVRSAEKEER